MPSLSCCFGGEPPEKEDLFDTSAADEGRPSVNGYCCFGGAEEDKHKYGAYVNPAEYGWDKTEVIMLGAKSGISSRKLICADNGPEDTDVVVSREEHIMVFNKMRNANLHTPREMTRGTICAVPLGDDEALQSYVPPKFEKSKADLDFIVSRLRNNFLFLDSTDDQLNQLAEAMQLIEYRQRDIIIRQGDAEGDFFYMIKSGEVEFQDKGKYVGLAITGATFGELALLYNSPRAVSCVARSPLVTMWKVDRMTFRLIAAHNVTKQSNDLADKMRQIDLFQDWPQATVSKFLDAMTRVQFKEGQRIVQKGEEGKVFYIITEGRVKVHDIGLGDGNYQDQYFEAGQCFGERSLLTGEKRVANVTAVTAVTTLAMDRVTLEERLGPVQGLLERNMRKTFLKAIPFFQNCMEEIAFDQLAGRMVEVCYPKGTNLSEAGKPYQLNLWIIRHGSLFVYNAKNPEKFYKLGSGNYFGDTSIISGDTNHVASHTAVCEEDLTTWFLTREDIEAVVGEVELLVEAPEFRKFRKGKQSQSIRFKDLEQHRILGQGSFGKVWLVSHKNTGQSYALKFIPKRQTIDCQLVRAVIREKELLSNLHHPFILQQISSYQDDKNLYILLPIIPGGELYSVVAKRKTDAGALPDEEAAFYAACIIEALGHFHLRHIAYRDLKLENVLIDGDGYCVIVDLGFAKIVTDKTFTLVGTPEYFAPEIIMQRGHNHVVDYWSYGVLCYELLNGVTPFVGVKGADNRQKMFKRIVMVDYVFPPCNSELAQDFIRKLLIKQPAKRLGNLANGYLDVRNHSWFADAGIYYNEIIKKKKKAPWKPVTKDPLQLFETYKDYRHVETERDRSKALTTEEQALFVGF